ncbi:MAG: DUF58 domain-containing protein [Candidatus Thermoplasmatota archaeon]|nr:DUF58 domain-containing protein [Candidatus Thermoplasmatota archaeon]
MEKTRRTRVLLAAAATLYILAYAYTTLTPAIVATLLLALLARARLRFTTLLDRALFEAETHRPDRMVYQDEPVTLRWTLFVHPPGLRVDVELEGSEDLKPLSVDHTVEDLTTQGTLLDVKARVQPTRRGTHRQRHLTVTLTDPDGFFEHTYHVEAPVEFTAHAPKKALRQGRQASRLEQLVNPRSNEPGAWSLEVMAHREYQPTDRPRDIDWKASARFQDLLTRVYIKEVERPLVVVLDASRSMRHRTTRASLLDHAAQLAMAVVGAAYHQGTPVGFVAHDAHQVLDIVPTSRDQSATREIAQAIAELPEPIDLAPQAANTLLYHAPDEAPRKGPPTPFEQKIAPFLGGRPGGRPPHGLTRALQRAAPTGAPHTLVILTDLQGPASETIRALSTVQRHQHRVILASPFSPWFHLSPKQVTAELLEATYDAHQRHQRLLGKLEKMGVLTLDISPDTPVQRLFTKMAQPGGQRP